MVNRAFTSELEKIEQLFSEVLTSQSVGLSFWLSMSIDPPLSIGRNLI